MSTPASTPTLPLVLGLVGGLVGGMLGASTLPMLTSSSSEDDQLDALSKQVSAYEIQVTELKQQLATQAIAVANAASQATAAAKASADQPPREVSAASEDAIRAFLINNPDVIFMDALETFQANEPIYTARRFAKVLDSGLRDPLYNSSSDPFLGNPDGDVVLVEFFDYNCGYCKRSAPDLFKTVEADGNIKLVMKEFPILSEASRVAAQAALASQKQGLYDVYHTTLMNFQGRVTEDVVFEVAQEVGLDVDQLKVDMQSDFVAQKLAQTSALADQLGVTGTPAFMVGNTFLPGAVPAAQIEQAVDLARKVASNS